MTPERKAGRRRAALVAVVVALSAFPAFSGEWLSYYNARFGTSADVPSQGFTAL